MVRPWSQQISLSKWWGPRMHVFPTEGQCRSLRVKLYAYTRGLDGLLWCTHIWVSVCADFLRTRYRYQSNDLKYYNPWITNSKMTFFFFETEKYLAVKLVSETLCLTKYWNHGSFVSFAARRDIGGHSELETRCFLPEPGLEPWPLEAPSHGPSGIPHCLLWMALL